jgi:hypothetical protein
MENEEGITGGDKKSEWYAPEMEIRLSADIIGISHTTGLGSNSISLQNKSGWNKMGENSNRKPEQKQSA